MAGTHAVAGRTGGGAGIQALRPARARLITALGALASLAGAGAYATTAGDRWAFVSLGTGAAAVLLLGLGLVLRWPSTIPWSVILVAAGYLVSVDGHPVVDGWAALVGVALLVSAELASWSIEHDRRIRSESGLVARRAAMIGALAAAALLVNFILLAAAAVSASEGVLLAAVGVAAAVAAVSVVLRLLRSS
jgi:hypothetical protein